LDRPAFLRRLATAYGDQAAATAAEALNLA
ncbi:MAG: hypothetical protein QOG10_2589, partial [Kribbellaceae bacterium]|nr:hypothetical protein [Kribbellaceae bacterium]